MSALLTLAIETSGPVGGIALGHINRSIAWQKDFPTGPRAGGGLFVALEECFAANPSPERIVVGVGPGSYAGVRLALAAASGLGLALSLEPIGVPSVCAYAVAAPAFHAIGDARRGAFYYTGVQGGRCVRGPEICDEAELRERLASESDWPVFSTEPLPAFPQAARATARAAQLLSVPAERLVRALEPIYLREPHITRPRALVP